MSREGGDGPGVGAPEHVEGIHSVQDKGMTTEIRGPEKGRNNRYYRAVEQITRHPLTDALLADQLLAAETPEAEKLGAKVARSMGRGRAEGFVFLQRETLAIAAKRAGHALSSPYYDRLWDAFLEAEDERRDEITDEAVATAKERFDDFAVKTRDLNQVKHWLGNCAELDLGLFFPAIRGGRCR